MNIVQYITYPMCQQRGYFVEQYDNFPRQYDIALSINHAASLFILSVYEDRI